MIYMVKIIYSVNGEGLGHATRSDPIIHHLLKKNEVKIFSSGRSYAYLSHRFKDVHELAGLAIQYKNNRVDEFGTVYQHEGNDRYDKVQSLSHGLVYDKITKHGCDRNCNWFNENKLNQELLSKKIFEKILNGKSITDSPDEPFTHFFNFTSRANDPELQRLITHEKLEAEKTFEILFPKIKINH